MAEDKKVLLKIHLRSIAELHELTQMDKYTWQSKHRTHYISTTHGFIFDTHENRNSHNIQLIEL
jgi:hypothetical protein